VEQAKTQKDLNFATFGAGTPGHFGAVAFADTAGLKVEPIHYRSPADALGGLASGSVHAGFITVGVAAPHIKAGRLRALATTGESRSGALPDTPTLTESGYPLSFAAWFGFVAPAQTPAEALDALNAAVAKAVQAPEVRTKLEAAGFRMVGSSRAEFARLIQSDAARWGAIVKATGFRATID
jgi:tripartite-type tricarboxylate transporter receptor subunit TctC